MSGTKKKLEREGYELVTFDSGGGSATDKTEEIIKLTFFYIAYASNHSLISLLKLKTF